MNTDLFKKKEVWFLTGSQHLYGPQTIAQVEQDSQKIVAALNAAAEIPLDVTYKPVLTNPAAITAVCQEANNAPACAGVITWCHTFSPSKMWINGLKKLQKPLLHFHTQFNRDLPWGEIDMDFMNLNQSAHGDREHGFIMSRMRMNRKVVVGHWSDQAVLKQIGDWMRSAAAWAAWQDLRIARFGDNMREVAVTEGDKVAAEEKFGFSTNGYGIEDLVQAVNQASEKDIDVLVEQYISLYKIAPDLKPDGARHTSVRDAARIEAGMRNFLTQGGFGAFSTTFESLHGLAQLPGLAVQRLMADGYGFGAEGDWKTAALVYAEKAMASQGGTSFMEDYTYDLGRGQVLGAHMLEVCPTIANGPVSLQVHPLGIGGKADPARLVFDTALGPAINASLIDLGNRFRLILNEVEVVDHPPMPKLPVAQAVWRPKPDLATGAAAWIYAGGAHHTAFSQGVTIEMMQDFADMAEIECVVIDGKTNLQQFRQELRWNEMYYMLARGL